LRRRGDEMATAGALTEASEAYEEAIRLGGFDRAAYLKLAEFYFDAYQPQEARDTLRRLVDAAPDEGETYRGLIKISLRRENEFGLREQIAFALKKKDTYLSKLLALVGLPPRENLKTKDANYYLARSYLAMLKYMQQQPDAEQLLEEMIEAVRKSIELDGTNPDAHYLLARGIYFRYFGLFASGDPTAEQYDEVIRVLEKSVDIDPHAPLAVSSLGDAYFAAGRYEDAIASYQRRRRLTPRTHSPQFQIAVAYAHLERFQDAVDTMRKALEWQQGARLTLGEHGWSIQTLKCVEESKETDVLLKRSACLFASYASALFSTTAYKWDSPKMGDEALDACLSWYEKALTYPAGNPDPFEWHAHLSAGAEYLRRGGDENCERAEAALIKSAALRPDAYADYEIAEHQRSSQPFELLAECYFYTGRLELAREAQHKHIGMIGRACERLRQRLDALEAQPAESDTSSRQRTLKFLLSAGEEYQAKAAQRLAEMSGEIGEG
jgi:predicted Zn-dependent protease